MRYGLVIAVVAVFAASAQQQVTLRSTRAVMIDGDASQPWQAGVNYASAQLQASGGPVDVAALMWWDVSAIPAGSQLYSAALLLATSGDDGARFPVYAVLRPWVHTQVTWNVAATGTPWTAAGAQGVGSDRDGQVLAFVDNDSSVFALNAAGVAVVQGWVSGAAPNHGFIVQDYARSGTVRWSGETDTSASRRPRLRVAWDGGTSELQAGAYDAVIASGPDPRGINRDSERLRLDGQAQSAGALIAFDLTSIPTGVQVQAVSLLVDARSGSSDGFGIYALGRAWTESGASWLTTDGATPWAMPGATGAADRGPTLLGTVLAPSQQSVSAALNAAGVAVVQGWVDAPSSNFGLTVQDYTKTDGLELSDDEDGPSQAPGLLVTYSASGLSPVAVLTPPAQTADPGASVTVDGSGSAPSTGATLTTFEWSLFEGPAGVELAANALQQSLRLDEPGRYGLQLVVRDSAGKSSTPARATLTVSGQVLPPRLGCQCNGAAGLAPIAALLLARAVTRRRLPRGGAS